MKMNDRRPPHIHQTTTKKYLCVCVWRFIKQQQQQAKCIDQAQQHIKIYSERKERVPIFEKKKTTM